MIQPSALNLIIVLAMMVIASFLWRATAAKLAERESAFGKAMSNLL